MIFSLFLFMVAGHFVVHQLVLCVCVFGGSLFSANVAKMAFFEDVQKSGFFKNLTFFENKTAL